MEGTWPRTVLIAGCGNMGGAMLAGWLAEGVGSGIPPSRFTVVDPMLASAPDGVALLRDFPSGGQVFDAILLGVKPQMLADVAPRAAACASSETVVLSILAGVELDSLARHFPHAGGLVRVMPNLAAAIGKSPVALAARGLTDSRRDDVTRLMRLLGTPEWLADEGLFDAVTALAGSGPAFVYRFVDALARAGEALGLPREQSAALALATAEGAALLAAGSGHPPGELARRVASPGGTTQAGLDVLDSGDGLLRLIETTLRAARDRGAEMAAAARLPEGRG